LFLVLPSQEKPSLENPKIFTFFNLHSKQIADEPADVIEQVTQLDVPFSDSDHGEHQATIEPSS